MKIDKETDVVSGCGRLLIMDDESDLANSLCEVLTRKGYEATGVTTPEEALEILRTQTFDLMLIDLKMPEMGGITLMREALRIDPNLGAIIMTGYGSVETAVEAMKFGALDYVLKPISLNSLLTVLSHAMETRRLRMENVQLHQLLDIYELSMAAAFHPDHDVILNKVADTIVQEFDPDELSIMLRTKEENELSVAVVRGRNRKDILGYRMSMDRGISGWVATHKETVMLQGEVNDQRFFPVSPRSDIRSSLSIPMMARGKLVGVVNLNAIRRRPFTPGDAMALNIMITIAGSALENARLHEEVKQAENKYRSIFENAAEGIFQTDPDGHFLNANPAMALMLGYDSPQELISSIAKIPNQFYVEPERHSHFFQMIKDNGGVKDFESRVYRKDGSMIWISEKSRAIKDKEGKVIYHEGMCEDITARKQTEEALKEEKEKFRILVEKSPFGVSVIGRNGDYKYINPKFVQMFGYTLNDIPTSRAWFEKAYPDKKERDEAISACIIDERHSNQSAVPGQAGMGEGRDRIFTVQCKGGHQKLIRFLRVTLETGDHFVIYEDVTEAKKIEAQAIQSQKVEAIGRLAGGVAHDFNNILTGIVGFADLITNSLGKDDPIRAEVEEIKKAAARGSSLTRQLLAFSRKQVLRPKILDLNFLVKNMAKMLRRIIGDEIHLETRLQPEPAKIKGDPGQMEQVIMNLAVNARDAMPQGGKLTIETFTINLDETYVRDYDIKLGPGPHVMLAIMDTGIGMDREIREHVFEPFFTTKNKNKGTGLGLATVYGIVKQSNGHISVFSEPKKGTAFKIYFPAIEEETASEKKVETSPPVLKGAGEVLTDNTH